MVNYVLFETASGYALFEILQVEEIGAKLESVQEAVKDLTKFGKGVKLKSFAPFKNAAHALENANDISEGVINDYLREFLELNLPAPAKSKKKNPVILGIIDKNLASSIVSQLKYECETSELVLEIIRGIRLHADKLLGQMKEGDLERAQLGLGHSFSRAKVKFNINRSDNMIIQAISLLDQLDKDVNTFAMRVREWYSWHFPELVKIVNDNHQYAKLAKFIKNKADLTEDNLQGLEDITEDETKAQQILEAARSSMGTDISDVDMLNIEHFANCVINLANYRKSLLDYLRSKMSVVAPNLSALIGEVIGARLISHAGSLTNLSKYPASTVQILGAEKALFRALKTKGNTPKYGLLYHSTYIGRAGAKNKGRISRFLANKCTIASRIDCFTEKPTSKFGEALKEQVERRLMFFETGAKPLKNIDAMKKVLDSIASEDKMELDSKPVLPHIDQDDESDESDESEDNEDIQEKEPQKAPSSKASESSSKKRKATTKKIDGEPGPNKAPKILESEDISSKKITKSKDSSDSSTESSESEALSNVVKTTKKILDFPKDNKVKTPKKKSTSAHSAKQETPKVISKSKKNKKNGDGLKNEKSQFGEVAVKKIKSEEKQKTIDDNGTTEQTKASKKNATKTVDKKLKKAKKSKGKDKDDA
ncbi:hypothetical protein G9A89_004902 [Geosiphon pyriformis]|nr:hypothetical protein G9A89_004902 [Geosiphon pyriformis]